MTTSFGGFTQITFGDISGDHDADILTTDANGTLWYYPNNFNSNNRYPFSSGLNIGNGWTIYNRVVAADVSGDGYADILATKPDTGATLWYYPNNFNSNNRYPFSSSLIMYGW